MIIDHVFDRYEQQLRDLGKPGPVAQTFRGLLLKWEQNKEPLPPPDDRRARWAFDKGFSSNVRAKPWTCLTKAARTMDGTPGWDGQGRGTSSKTIGKRIGSRRMMMRMIHRLEERRRRRPPRLCPPRRWSFRAWG